MGVDAFKKFLEKIELKPKNIPITEFKGKRIAVDASIYFFKYMSVCTSRVVDKTNLAEKDPDRGYILQLFIGMLLDQALFFLKYDITPIFVFDGPTHMYKLATEARELERKEKKRVIDELYQRVRNPVAGVANEKDIETLRTKLKGNTSVSLKERKMIYQTFKDLDIPCMIAKHDAEHLCASLAIEGIVAAVYSTDTDCLACGTPLFLNDKDWVVNEKGEKVMAFQGYFLEEVLVKSGLSFEKFQDMCICAGVDFNKGTKPKGSGIGKAYKHFSSGKSIVDMQNTYGDKFVGFNYMKSKELFAVDVWENLLSEKEKEIDRLFNVRVKNIYKEGGMFLMKYKDQTYLMDFAQKLVSLSIPKSVPCRPPHGAIRGG